MAPVRADQRGEPYHRHSFDITKDMLEKQKIEHERDYDVLTGLFNRRSFTASFAERFDEPQKLRTACLIM